MRVIVSERYRPPRTTNLGQRRSTTFDEWVELVHKHLDIYDSAENPLTVSFTALYIVEAH
jgi:hypothetical protein